MESVVTAVETAIKDAETHVEAEAHSIEAKALEVVKGIETEAKTTFGEVERSVLVHKFADNIAAIEAGMKKMAEPKWLAVDTFTQEETAVLRGAFSRFVHRLVEAI